MSELRVAILGCGGMAGAHARRFKARDDVQIVALCDIVPEQMASLVERRLDDYSPTPTFFTDAAEMYRQADLDAVAIVTPHTLHYDQAVQALDAGCHVLLEKPMVTRTDHARALAEKVRETGKVLVVCYNTSFTAPFLYLREAVRNGTYGRLEMVHGYLSQNWKNATAGTWRHDPAQSGGGQAYDSGAHLLNSLCWTVESRVAEVFALLDNQDDTVDINASIAARFASGVMATIAVSGNCPSNGTHMVFVFDGGRVEIDGWGGGWIRVFNGDGEVEDVALPDAPVSANDNFVESILGRAEPLVTVDNGIIQCELMDAVYESARTGQAVSLRK